MKSLQIELTSKCNEKCVHCYIPNAAKRHNMDISLLWNIIDQCREMNIKQIVISGGEPMLHPAFPEIFDRANWDGLKISVFSNLTLLNDAILEKLKEHKTHICEIQASLYSVEPEIHDAVTKLTGSCELTKKWIKILNEEKIPLFISCPMTKINKNSYIAVLDFAKQLGLGSAPSDIIFAKSDGSKENLKYRLDNDEALQVIQDILNNDTAYDAERFLPGYKNTDDALPCVQNICKDALCVNAYGEITPLPDWHKVLGNLNEQRLLDIWENSSEIQKLQNLSLKDFPKCLSCPDIHFCGMNLGNNANENIDGNPLIIPKHICDYARAVRNMVHSFHKQKELLNAKTNF